MGKVHLVSRKEDLDQERVRGQVVVVLDILFATSAVVSALSYGAREVIPVCDEWEARRVAEGKETYLLAGENQGKFIDGFLSPFPNDWKEKLREKTIVLSTTNGTVAVRKASQASAVYIGALLNSCFIAKYLTTNHRHQEIVILCSGSGGRFSLEDFYGAGCLIHYLLRFDETWQSSDAARSALLLYQHHPDPLALLSLSRVGKGMIRHGYGREVAFAAQQNLFPLIPRLDQGVIRPLAFG
jgi:2-phosphosulfolactate phosphatase